MEVERKRTKKGKRINKPEKLLWGWEKKIRKKWEDEEAERKSCKGMAIGGKESEYELKTRKKERMN